METTNKNYLSQNETMKRIFDIIFSTLAIILTSPLIIIFIIIIKTEQVLRGTPFASFLYHEVRYTKGRPFTFYKFNIFKQEVLDDMLRDGDFVHTKNIERNGGLTKFGWVLKQIYLDELPQIFNVFVGDMSIVGPRPANQEVFDLLMSRNITSKSLVKAGLTGNFQSHKNTAGIKANDLDYQYVQFLITKPWYKVIIFDIKIMLRTIKLLVRAQGL